MWRSIAGIMLAALVVWPAQAKEPVHRTWLEAREGCVVKQKYDFSCGLAALATLFQNELGMPVGEAEVLAKLITLVTPKEKLTEESDAVLKQAHSTCGDQVAFDGDAREELLKNGASLLQLWCLARMYGVESYVREANLEFLRKNLDRPIVIHLTIGEGLKHFAVLRKITGRWVHLADPSRGCKVYLLSSFLREWKERQVLLLHRPHDYTPLSGVLGVSHTGEDLENLRREAIQPFLTR